MEALALTGVPAMTVGTFQMTDTALARAVTMAGDLTVTTLLDLDCVAAATTLTMAGNDILGGATIDLTDGGGAACTIATAASITAGTIDITADGTGNSGITQTATGTITASGTITLDGDASGRLTAFATGSGIVGTNLTITLGIVNVTNAPLDLSGNLTIGAAGATLTTTTAAIGIGGNMTVGLGTFNPGGGGAAGTLTFDGTADQTIDFINVTLDSTDAVVIGNSGGAICSFGDSTPGATTIPGNLTVNAGAIGKVINGALAVTNDTLLNGKLTTVANQITLTDTLNNSTIIGASGELEATGAANIIFDNATAVTINNSAGGIIDLAQTSTLRTDTVTTITTGAGGVTIGAFDDSNLSNENLTFNGTGTVKFLVSFGLDLTVGGVLTFGTGVTVISAGGFNTTNDVITIQGTLTLDTNQTITLNGGNALTVQGLLTVQGVTVTIADGGAGGEQTLNLTGGFSINSELVNTADGDITINVGASTTCTVGDKLTLSGVAGNRLLLTSDTLGTQFNLVVNSGGTLDFEWVAIRDCNLTNNGTVSIVAYDDSVVNATGNTGWPTGAFSTPVPQGSSAITTFTTTAISNASSGNDSQTYNMDVAIDATAQTTAQVTSASQATIGATVAGSATSTWDDGDTPTLANSPLGAYSVYMDPAAAQSDFGLYIIVSDFTVNLSKVIFLASNGDAPTSGTDKVFTSFVIDWTDDGDANSTIELRFSTNGALTNLSDVLNPANTTQITTVPASTDANDGSFTWDTSGLATEAGTTFFIYSISSPSGPAASFAVSKGVTLKGIDYVSPEDTGITVDTASTDPAVITAHTTYTVQWTDWDTATGDIDVYASQAVYTTPAAVLAATALTDDATKAIEIQTNVAPAAADTSSWDLSSGPVAVGAYFIYAIADDPNDATFDTLVTSTGKVTVKHSPFFFTDAVTIPTTADSGVTATTPDPITLTWKGADFDQVGTVGIFFALSTTVIANPDNFDTTAEIIANAVEASASDSAAVLQQVTALTGNDALPEESTGFSIWNYYDTTVVTNVPPGEYIVWITISEPAGGAQAFKQSANNVTISHSANIQLDLPLSSAGAETVSNKFFTIAWTDVDSDESATVDLFYSKSDLRAQGGVGGTLTTSQIGTAKGFTKITTTAVGEDPDGASDRSLFDLAGVPTEPINDSQTYFLYALISPTANTSYQAGYQSGGIISQKAASIAVTTPAGADQTTLNYNVQWLEEWADPTVTLTVDLYFDTVNTKVLGDLDDGLGTGNAPAGIIEQGIALDTDTSGVRTGVNSAIWDDIVLTSTTAATGGTSTTLIDTSGDSPLSTTVGNDYYIGRRHWSLSSGGLVVW